ncbi:MAG TPA: DUF222 domain-containing protein [Frankiaceae bacterium]|nr:DUF222 domain-containing protein [Frankiaceae bacterium]
MFEILSPTGKVAAALIAPPGPSCVHALSDIDPRLLGPSAQVDLLIAWERQSAWICSRVQLSMAAVGDTVQADMQAGLDSREDAALPRRAAHAEIGMALRLSDVTASGRLMTARALTTELPAVQAALAAGDISFWHAHAIVDATASLSPEKARIVADRVLPRAAKQTVAQLRRCLNRAVLAVEPKTAAERARQAHADRTLDWWPLPDGMAELRLIASATEVMAVFNAADAVAQKAKVAGPAAGSDGWEPITALRADALIALAVGQAQAARPVAVNVTLDLPTLLGLQDNPGELAGYGPLPAPLARALAADGRWRRMIHDPQTGALLDLGRTSYQPSEALARYVKTRDRTCIFPTCNRAAHRCEVDHRQPYRTGGPTDRHNLHPLCLNHHQLKHKAGWTLRNNPITSGCTWTSPTGHTYTTAPEDHRPTLTENEPAENEPAENEPADCPF